MDKHQTKRGNKMANQRTTFYIDPYYIQIAKSVYKRGQYAHASNSSFLRAVLEDVAKTVKKAVTK